MNLEIGNTLPLEYGCRCRLKKSTIFGTFCGFTSSTEKFARFYDEELGKVKVYRTTQLERSYEKDY